MTNSKSTLVQIEKPVYGGACLARSEGGVIFVPLTLPGETARVRVVEQKRGYANAEAVAIETSAPQRVAPACRHFGHCGGCDYQHANYETQLRMKKTILRETLERGAVSAPETIHVLAGEPWHYRNRIRLAFNAAGEIGYRSRRSHAVTPIRECPIAAPLLVEAGLAFGEIVRPIFRSALPAELTLFCNAQETALLISLVVGHASRRQLEEMVRALAERIPVLRGVECLAKTSEREPPRRIWSWGEPSLNYRAAGSDYRVDQGAFFQVNRWLVDRLVERVVSDRRGKLAWDLYAGVGLFVRSLAGRFERVLAVESTSAATESLAANLNGTNFETVRSSTHAFLESAPRRERPDLIVIDPPRTGLGVETAALLAKTQAPAIVYVSCDPATLARDLRELLGSGYAIASMTLADLFPQTFHLETVVELRRS